MTSYKIVYFDGRGRAEISRMILTAAGVKFEDVRVKDWPKGILILTLKIFFDYYYKNTFKVKIKLP